MRKSRRNPKGTPEVATTTAAITIHKPNSFLSEKCLIDKSDPFRDRLFAAGYMLEQLLNEFHKQKLLEKDIVEDIRFMILDYLGGDSVAAEAEIDGNECYHNLEKKDLDFDDEEYEFDNYNN